MADVLISELLAKIVALENANKRAEDAHRACREELTKTKKILSDCSQCSCLLEEHLAEQQAARAAELWAEAFAATNDAATRAMRERNLQRGQERQRLNDGVLEDTIAELRAIAEQRRRDEQFERDEQRGRNNSAVVHSSFEDTMATADCYFDTFREQDRRSDKIRDEGLDAAMAASVASAADEAENRRKNEVAIMTKNDAELAQRLAIEQEASFVRADDTALAFGGQFGRVTVPRESRDRVAPRSDALVVKKHNASRYGGDARGSR